MAADRFAGRSRALKLCPPRPRSRRLPTLIRFVLVLGGLAAAIYGGLFYLANFVKVQPHEITETVTLPKAPK